MEHQANSEEEVEEVEEGGGFELISSQRSWEHTDTVLP